MTMDIIPELTHAEQTRRMDAQLNAILNRYNACYEVFAEGDPEILLVRLRELLYAAQSAYRHQERLCNPLSDAEADQDINAEIVERWAKEEMERQQANRDRQDPPGEYATGVDGFGAAPQ